MRPRPGRRPERISTLLPRVLADLGLEDSARAARIAEHWAEWMGEETAGHCHPVLLRRDILELAADSSTWAQAVRLRAPEIMKILADRLGGSAPTGLCVRVGWRKDESNDG